MSGRTGWIAGAAVAIGVLAAVGAWTYERPPAPLPADAPAEQFSAIRARDLLEQIAVRPHAVGSPEHARVRAWLVAALEDLGFEVEVQQASMARTAAGFVDAATVRNVVARKPGTASTGGVALAAHYDSRALAPGAGDDGSGVAAILEALRALSVAEPLRNDLYVVITDGEELGLVGARAFVNEHPWWQNISVLLNFDSRGSSGASVLFETNADNGWIVREFARADPRPAASSLYYEIYQQLPNSTDFRVFKNAGVTGLNFAFAEGSDVYHRPSDTIENLSLASLQQLGEHVLALGRHFGNLDLSGPTKAPDVVYFRLPLLGLVVYSTALARVFALGSLFLSVVVVGKGLGRHRLSLQGIAAGLGAIVGAGALAAVLSFFMLVLVRIVHHEDGSIIGRYLYDESWYGLAVVCLAAASLALGIAYLGRRVRVVSLAAGALLIPLALGLLASWYAPGVSMLFVWPSVLGLLPLAWLVARGEDAPHGYLDLAVIGSLTASSILVLFPLPYAVFIGLSIASAPTLAVVITIALSPLLLWLDIAGARRRRFAAAGFIAALACTGLGLVTAAPGPQRPIPVSLYYVQDRDEGRAFWITTSEDTWPWLEQFIEPNAPEEVLSEDIAGVPGEGRVTPAPLIEAPAAKVEILSDTETRGVRTLRVGLRSALGRESIRIYPAAGEQLSLLAVNGDEVRWPAEDDPPASWVLSHRGEPPDDMLTFVIATREPDAPILLELRESVMSLPSVEGYRMQRPPELVAPGLELTDVSLFLERIRID